MSKIRQASNFNIKVTLGVKFSKLFYALFRSHQPPKVTASVSKQSRQVTEILDAKNVSTTNSNFLWMIRTSIQLLCASTLSNWPHDGGTVIEVYHLPLESVHTNNYLPRNIDNIATCDIATLPRRREKAPRRKPPSSNRHNFKRAGPRHHELGLVTSSRSRTALPCFAFIGIVSPRFGRETPGIY